MPKVVVVHGNHHIEFRAHKAIKAGEELFFNYGKQFEGIATEEKQQHNDKRKRTSPPEPEVPVSPSVPLSVHMLTRLINSFQLRLRKNRRHHLHMHLSDRRITAMAMSRSSLA
jgi:hypothetical protein